MQSRFQAQIAACFAQLATHIGNLQAADHALPFLELQGYVLKSGLP
jgi:hypothetical protein